MKQMKLFAACAAILSGMFFLSLSASAQSGWGALATLKGQTKVNCEFDYSDAIIQGMTEEQFSAEEPNWGLAQKEVAAKFVEEFNERIIRSRTPFVVGQFDDADYTICIKPSNIVRKGNFYGKVFLVDRSGNTIMDVPIQAKGGHFGTFWNLLGDGMKDAAKIIAYKYFDVTK